MSGVPRDGWTYCAEHEHLGDIALGVLLLPKASVKASLPASDAGKEALTDQG